MSSVCHVLPYLSTEQGGPVVAAAAMAKGLVQVGWQVRVAGVLCGEETVSEAFDGVPVEPFRSTLPGRIRFSRALEKNLNTSAEDLFHSHGIWTGVHKTIAAAARRRGVPHVIGPCGMLMPLAMQRSRWKKQLAWRAFQQLALREAACLIANSEKERIDIERLGLDRPVALVPNPIDVPPETTLQSFGRAEEVWPELQGKRIVLFLGRVHPVKGPKRLVEAWAMVEHRLRESWQLVIAGPDEGGYRTEVEAQIDTLGCRRSVSFLGSLDQQLKWRALLAADLFVLPSDFENFGMAAAEAMWVRTPVVATRGTPWRTIEDRNAGWWVEPTAAAVAAAITRGIELDDHTRARMGENAREIAAEMTVVAVGRTLDEIYRWLLGESDRPAAVRG